MPQKERLRVWRNELKKTSGGLTRDQLTKNKRGKIVSRKKSGQAVGDANNLGSWLRGKGDKFAGKPKGLDEKEEEKLAEVPAKKTKVKSLSGSSASKKAVKQAAPKKQVAPKKVPVAPKKVPVPKKKKVVVVDLTDSPVKAPKKPKKKKKLEPMMPGEKKSSNISVGNIIAPTKVDEEKEKAMYEELRKMGMSDKEIKDALGGGFSSLAGKVRRMLKASKRRGKRRTKKQLLQDVLDL